MRAAQARSCRHLLRAAGESVTGARGSADRLQRDVAVTRSNQHTAWDAGIGVGGYFGKSFRKLFFLSFFFFLSVISWLNISCHFKIPPKENLVHECLYKSWGPGPSALWEKDKEVDREHENSEGASSFPSVFCCHTTPGNALPPKFSREPKALELFILHCSRKSCKDVRFIFFSL